MDKNLLKQVSKNASLFWSVNKKDLPYLSTEAVVETILNYGDVDDILLLFETIGLDKAADIFNKQVSRVRSNYHPRTANYFKLYFKRNAHRNTR